MLDLKKIFLNPVSLIKVDYHEKDFLNLPKLLPGKPKIYSVLDELSICDHYNNLEKENKYLIFVNIDEIIEILHDNLKNNTETVDFCSVIILNNIHSFSSDKILIINLWKEIFKISKLRPYLIITTCSEYIPELSINFKSDQIQDISNRSEKELGYFNDNFNPLSSDIEKYLSEIIIYKHKNMKLENNNIWVVFYSGKEDLGETLLRNLGNDVNIYDRKSLRKTKKFFPGDKRNIIILDNDFLPSIFSNNITGIFDSMITKIGEKITYSSKQFSEIRASYQKNGFVFRLCTKEHYKTMPKITPVELNKNNLDKRYLKMSDLKINLGYLFSPLITKEKLKEDISELEKRGAIFNHKSTDLGNMIISLPFETENCHFINEWMKTKNPIFPALVAASVSEIKEPLYLEGNKSFTGYLNKINEILKEETSLNKIDYEKILEKHNINIRVLNQIFDKIICAIKILEKKYTIQVGVFNASKLIKLLIPYYEKSYYNNTFTLIDRKNMLYRNKEKVYKLGENIFDFDISNPPSRLFCFEKYDFNSDIKTYQKIKKIICYYL